MITIVGMESAVVDVVSMVAILQQRSIGEHEGKKTTRKKRYIYIYLPVLIFIPYLSEVETFSIRDGKRWTCGIQVRLHVIS
ncbi:hypothetical protein F4703DRAFT_1741687 [Phycomyces blakesleeanus]